MSNPEPSCEITTELMAGNYTPAPRRSKYNRKLWWNWNGKEHVIQLAALCYTGRELLIGGGKGSGKSALALMRAAQYMDVRGYGALIIRRTWSELAGSGSLIEKAFEFFAPFIQSGEMDWNENKKRFKTKEGAILQFGHMEHERDKVQYQGKEYHYVCTDQAEAIEPTALMYLRAQQRRIQGSNIPLRFDLLANPGGVAHDFLKGRYMSGDPDKCYIHANLDDNPFVDKAEAEESLRALSANDVEYQQMRYGNWDLMAKGDILQGAWFEDLPESSIPEPQGFQVRSWDVAGKIIRADGTLGDETVGTLVQYDKKTGTFYVVDQIAFRATPMQVEDRIEATMVADESMFRTLTIEEKPPGEAGFDREQRRIKRFCSEGGHWYRIRGSQLSKVSRATGTCRDPLERALSLSSLAQRGKIKLKTGAWNAKLRLQANTFGQPKVKDDTIDSLSLNINEFTNELRNTRQILSGGRVSMLPVGMSLTSMLNRRTIW